MPGVVTGLALVDTPHFYLEKWGDTPAKLKRTYGTFEKFKKTWTKEVFWNKKRTKHLEQNKNKSPLKRKFQINKGQCNVYQ